LFLINTTLPGLHLVGLLYIITLHRFLILTLNENEVYPPSGCISPWDTPSGIPDGPIHRSECNDKDKSPNYL